MLTCLALEPQDNLLGSLSLLVENGLGLTTISRLFAVITTFPWGSKTVLTLLVLGHLMQDMLGNVLNIFVFTFIQVLTVEILLV